MIFETVAHLRWLRANQRNSGLVSNVPLEQGHENSMKKNFYPNGNQNAHCMPTEHGDFGVVRPSGRGRSLLQLSRSRQIGLRFGGNRCACSFSLCDSASLPPPSALPLNGREQRATDGRCQCQLVPQTDILPQQTWKTDGRAAAGHRTDHNVLARLRL